MAPRFLPRRAPRADRAADLQRDRREHARRTCRAAPRWSVRRIRAACSLRPCGNRRMFASETNTKRWRSTVRRENQNGKGIMSTHNPRFAAIRELGTHTPRQVPYPTDDAGQRLKVSDFFGCSTFGPHQMRDKLPADVFAKLRSTI